MAGPFKLKKGEELASFFKSHTFDHVEDVGPTENNAKKLEAKRLAENEAKISAKQDAKEDADGVTTNIKMPKVMIDGKTNKLNEAKIAKEKARVAALTPEELQAEKDALIKRKKAFDLKNKR